MSNIAIPPGQFAKFTLAGNGGSGPAALLAGSTVVSLSTADYANVYVADLGNDPAGPGRVLAIVPKVPAIPGGSYTVSLNCIGRDAASGNPLTPLSLVAEIDGPAPQAPAATNFAGFNSSFDVLANAPADPGTASIEF